MHNQGAGETAAPCSAKGIFWASPGKSLLFLMTICYFHLGAQMKVAYLPSKQGVARGSQRCPGCQRRVISGKSRFWNWNGERDGTAADRRQGLRRKQASQSRTNQLQCFYLEGNRFPHWYYKSGYTISVPPALPGKNLPSAGYPRIAPQPAAEEISICSY